MMKRMLMIVVAFATAVSILASPASPVFADDEVLWRALRDEMARSVESLQLEDLERPYYVEYRVDDLHQYWITASFGSVVRARPTRVRNLTVDVRVGDHDLDNSEFVSTELFQAGRVMQSSSLPLEDDYFALRHDLWLQTDKAYKIALEVLAKKRAARENKVTDEPIPDFSHEEPNVYVGDVLPYKFDEDKWERSIRELSSVFRDFPAIDDSNVEIRVQHLVRHYLNSEGSEYRKSEPSAIFVATASTYADDGTLLKDYVRFVVRLPDGFPDAKKLEKAVRDMATELTALKTAPVIEDYTGPVLFTGTAAADLMVQAVGLQCVGQRIPESDMPQLTQMMPKPKLADRVGKKGASEVLSVYDDPTKSEYKGTKLAGNYVVDDQGVPAQKVTLIEGGVVKSLLMSRRPRKEIPNSNGHARMPIYGVIGSDVTIGNLFVETPQPKSHEELVQELITFCNDEGLEFGLVVEKLDDEALTGVDVDSQEAMMSIFERRMGISIGAPIALYKVYAADGRRELVRGIGPTTVNIRSLRDITALGDDARAYNVLLTAGGGMFGGGIGQGFRISMSVPAAVVTPSVLFEEFDLKAGDEGRKKPTLLAHPSFE